MPKYSTEMKLLYAGTKNATKLLFHKHYNMLQGTKITSTKTIHATGQHIVHHKDRISFMLYDYEPGKFCVYIKSDSFSGFLQITIIS